MTTLMIKNLPMDKALDRKTMASVSGGNGMGGPTTNVTPSALPGSTGNVTSTASVGHTTGTTSSAANLLGLGLFMMEDGASPPTDRADAAYRNTLIHAFVNSR